MSKTEQIIELLKQKKTYKEIQKIVSCSKGTISYAAKKIGENKFIPRKYNWEEIFKFYKDGHTQKECLNKFRCSYGAWKRYQEDNDIVCHNLKIPLDDILIVGSSYNRGHLKQRLLDEKLLKNKCYVCDLDPIWNNMVLVLRLDHINGIYNDCRLENLRMICPNCDSQTETYSGRNKKYKNLLGNRSAEKDLGL